MNDTAALRNLERIQETPIDGGHRAGRGATLALAVGSFACLLFAGQAFFPHKATPAAKSADPLGDLVAHPSSPTILPGEVTFPGILSDRNNPAGPLAASNLPAGSATAGNGWVAPPPAADKLPVVPLPARHALGGISPSKSKDMLTSLAEGVTDPVTAGAALAPQGSEGGYQVQVSSFRTEPEAEFFANQLRARGHKAHVQRAEIPQRGTWYRVKIGPFGSQVEANKYRSGFEAREKIPAIVIKVDPVTH